ncbi:MAG: sigma-70 family RNA polymerase sigma factor [Chloroflexota bacterium]
MTKVSKLAAMGGHDGMNEEQSDWSGKYDNWSATRSDEWLVEVLVGESPEEIDVATRILQERYQEKLERYVYKKLPKDWVEDVTQEIWLAFYNKVKAEQIKTGVSNLLWRLARNKRVDAVRRLTAERSIEDDVPIGSGGAQDEIEIASPNEPMEEFLEKQIQLQFLPQIPFVDSLLSDCERVLWVLREQLDYPSPVVARLTDKKSQTVYSALSMARKRVREYLESEDFYLRIANQELQRGPSYLRLHDGGLVVERFTNCIIPQLTPDELTPLGLTSEEFRANYVASLLLPWEPHQGGETGYPSLVLARRLDWESMQEMFEQLYRNPSDTDLISPEECLLKIDVDQDNLVLRVEQMLEFILEPEDWSGTSRSDNTYLSVHSPRMTIPVTLGFFDRSLYTPDLYQRWPFLTEEAGL